MKFSIVTPTLNQAGFLPTCLDSILSQQGEFDLELIVRDGGSTDGSVEILEEFAAKDSRLKWISAEDRCQAQAINEGWAEATGDVLAYINSDDLYLPGALAAAHKAFEDDADCSWICGRCRIIDEAGNPTRNWIGAYKRFMLKRWRPVNLLFENYIPQPAVFLRRDAYEFAGEMDESLRYSLDYDYWLRLAKEFQLRLIEDEVACFRVHGRSITGGSIEPSFREAHQTARRHARLWGKPWASWVNFWVYYVRTSLVYYLIRW